MFQENQNSSCEFAEQMIGYLYGETNGGEKNKFESHLKSCADCADEFSGFGSIRSSVLEWREAEFSNLTTPHFELSAITGAKPQFVVGTEKPKSAFANLWSSWIFNPAFAASAILLLFVGAGIFIYSSRLSNEKYFAEVRDEPTNKVVVAPTVQNSGEVTGENKAFEINKNREIAIDKTANPVAVSVAKPGAPIEKSNDQNQLLKVSVKVPKTKSSISEVAAAASNNNRKPVSVHKSKAPTLTDTDEDEDDSVRLTDLFAELDTK